MQTPVEPYTYACFDGDDIGPQLELLLLEGKVEEARAYSTSVRSAMTRVVELLAAAGSLDVIAMGGDDLVASWPRGSISRNVVHRAVAEFRRMSGRTMSVGVGGSTKEAAENLHMAKLMGKNQVNFSASESI